MVSCHKIPINFPFPPYPQQTKFMNAVVDACEHSKNAMLESPTGTGKTLSLLCASLGWLRAFRKACPDTNYPRIIYLSRTHSQLSQVAKELKRTVYRPVVVTLASRDMLCVNPNANLYKGPQLNITCKRLRRSNMCPYAYNKAARSPELKSSIYDIEDLQAFGLRTKSCPFYCSRELIPHADVLLMPYNYLLDSKVRAQCTNIQYTNSVVIFDEAHNVQRVSEDASSFEVSVAELKKCVEEVRQLQKIKQSIILHEELYEDLAKDMDELTEDDVAFLEGPIDCFIEYLASVQNVGPDGIVYDGTKLFDIFIKGTKFSSDSETKDDPADAPGQPDPEKYVEHSQPGITPQNYYRYLAITRKCIDVLSTRNTGLHLEKWYHIVETVYNSMTREKADGQITGKCVSSLEDFKVVICDNSNYAMGQQEEAEFGRKKGFTSSAELQRKKVDIRCMKAFCFNPGLAFTELLKSNPRSIILTSGTLSPMDSLEHELRIRFPIKLECDHVINPDQAFIQVITRDQSGSLFNFNYQNRGNIKQRQNVGRLLQDICDVTPGGVLVFFSSYASLSQCWDSWTDDVIPAIRKRAQKSVFREEKTASQNQHALEQYKKSVENGEGAVLFAVCRGKISEGIDFSDDAARAVVVVGVPFPCSCDKRISLKEEYLDRHNQALQINGKAWYTQEAMKAVNQTIGRVIRHIYDYGAIVLVDQRYSSDWLRRNLSRWIRDKVKVTAKPEECVSQMEEFFGRMKAKKFPVRQPLQELPQDEGLDAGEREKEEDKTKTPASPAEGEQSPPQLRKRTSQRLCGTVVPVSKCKKESLAQGPKFILYSLDTPGCCGEEKKALAPPAPKAFKSEAAHEDLKENWMRSMHTLLVQTLGSGPTKQLVAAFQKYRTGKENGDPARLAQEAFELFAGARTKGCDDSMLEQIGDAVKKTSFLVPRKDRPVYLEKMAILLAAKSKESTEGKA